jgi:hypothetical protein
LQGEPAWRVKAFAEKTLAALIAGESCIGNGGSTTGTVIIDDKNPA